MRHVSGFEEREKEIMRTRMKKKWKKNVKIRTGTGTGTGTGRWKKTVRSDGPLLLSLSTISSLYQVQANYKLQICFTVAKRYYKRMS